MRVVPLKKKPEMKDGWCQKRIVMNSSPTQINYWQEEGEDESMAIFRPILGQTDHGVIFGLYPWTVYVVNVQVFNEAGVGPKSQDFPQETLRSGKCYVKYLHAYIIYILAYFNSSFASLQCIGDILNQKRYSTNQAISWVLKMMFGLQFWCTIR